jgi:aldose sugar dehydrogenase
MKYYKFINGDLDLWEYILYRPLQMIRPEIFLFTILVLTFALPRYYNNFSYAATGARTATVQPSEGPTINDPNLKVEVVSKGLKFPTSMAFLGPNDILVLEKNNGTVQRIVNGVILPKPLLDVNVATLNDRGMLGIAVAKNNNDRPTYVFLYFTESQTKDGEDVSKNIGRRESKEPLGNRLYRYELVDNKLLNPKLLLDIRAKAETLDLAVHNGGKVLIGPDENVYIVIGDIGGHKSLAENFFNKGPANGTSVIFKISRNGEAVGNILGDKEPINKYYAYGIRNSFGIDFDPVTKNLWDTENGPGYGDEINLVFPGFNSGWSKVQGIWKPASNYYTAGNITLQPDNLVNFGGKGKYSSPEFTWYNTVGPTAIKFLNSDKLGKQYQNDMFVGDFNNGNLYHFDLVHNRTALALNGSLADKVANNTSELQKGGIIFGQGFGGIMDIKVGPDGYLYILSVHKSIVGGSDCDPKFPNTPCIPYNSSAVSGVIYRIVPENIN